MKIKIIIAILAAVLIAYAGNARAQIIGTGCTDEEFSACVEKYFDEAMGDGYIHSLVPARRDLPVKVRDYMGRVSSASSKCAARTCSELCGRPFSLDLGWEANHLAFEAAMAEYGLKIPAEIMELFDCALNRVPPPPACDVCEAICYVDGVQTLCSKIDPCTQKFTCDIFALPKECPCDAECPSCKPPPGTECTKCNCSGVDMLCAEISLCTSLCAYDGNPVEGCTLGGMVPKYCP